MNKLEKLNNGIYVLTDENGTTHECTRWYEKKTGQWHVKLPKNNPTGRTYVRESKFDNSNVYEFETKTEFRIGLTSGGWRSKMTPEEKTEVEAAEATIERIKQACMTREVKKVDPNSVEGIEAEIAKLQAKLAKKKAQA